MATINGDKSVNGVTLFGTTLFHLLRDMVRWSLLSPMIVVGGIMLFFTIAMLAANFQEQAVTVSEVIPRLLEQYPFLNFFVVELEDPNPTGGIDLGGESFKRFLTDIYIKVTLLIVIAGTLYDFFRRGKKQRASYQNKIVVAAVVSLVVFAAWLVIYFFGSDPDLHRSTDTLFLAVIVSGLIFLLSSFSLWLSHVIAEFELKDRV